MAYPALIIQLWFLSSCLLLVEWLWYQLMVVWQRKGESTTMLSLALHSSAFTQLQCNKRQFLFFTHPLLLPSPSVRSSHVWDICLLQRKLWYEIFRIIRNSAQVSVSKEGRLLSLQVQTHHSYYQSTSGIVIENELEVDLSETFKTLLKHGNLHEESILWGTDMTLHLLRVFYNSTYYAI